MRDGKMRYAFYIVGIWAGLGLFLPQAVCAQRMDRQGGQQIVQQGGQQVGRSVDHYVGQQVSSTAGPLLPLGVEWKMINTPHHRLIFPAEHEAEARRVAALTGAAWGPLQRDFKTEVPPLPLILNTSRQVSNGYVTLGPRHSEWYAYNSQMQFAGPLDWYTLLALHEGRHAAQFTALKRGFTRFASWAAGEYGWAALAMYSMPLWYFEGDAILSETAFSSGGRGRSAAFHRQVRAIVGEERPVSYSQAYLGSYRTHFPNHYYLGFPLVTYIRLSYGEDAWNSIIRKTARFSFWPLRFHSAVKQVTGRSMRRVYQDALDYFAEYFEEFGPQMGSTDGDYTPAEQVRRAEDSEGVWTNYVPVAVEEGGLFVVRYGDRDAAALVRLDLQSSEEQLVSKLGAERQVSLRKGVAVWTEEVPHPLWSKVSTSEIIRYEIAEGRRSRITFGGAYQAPALSPGGKRIAAVRALPGGGGRLELLDADTGRVLRSVDTAEVDSAGDNENGRELGTKAGTEMGMGGPLYLRQPAWSPEGNKIAVVAVHKGRSRLLEYSVSEGVWRNLTNSVEYSISMPVYSEEFVLFVSERSGTEVVEAVDRRSGELFQVVKRPYAAGFPVVSSGEAGSDRRGRLYFADYRVDGFEPAVLDLDPERFMRADKVERRPIDYVGPIADRWGGPIVVDNGEEDYEVEEYPPTTGLMNFHSWGALPDTDGRVQLFAQSDDVLGRLSMMSFAGFNIRRERYDLGVQGTYRGIFPMVRFGVSGATDSPADPNTRGNGITVLLGFDAPLDFSRGLWTRQLNVSTTGFLRYEQAEPPAGETDKYELPVRHSLSLYNASRAVAPADFAPPYEQYLEGRWQYLPAPRDTWGSRVELNGGFTFPGLWKQHRLQLNWRSELKSGEEVPLTSTAVRPRGYPFDWNDEYEADAVLKLQYSLPLLYPDMEIGNVYYLKRLRGTLFADVGMGLPAGTGAPEWLRDLESGLGADLHPVGGAELLFEQHLFNWPVALEAGLRLVYRLRDERVRVEETLLLLGLEW